MKPTESMKEIVEKIHEGLRNLKSRTNYNSLRHIDKVWIVETAIEKYREHDDQDGLAHAMNIFHETNSAAIEDEAVFKATIWNAMVQAKGKMTTLGDLFSELESVLFE